MTLAAGVLALLRERGLTLAVAESLTGGALCDAFVSVPGASSVLRGAVVAYATPLKASVLGVDAALLEREGPVHPDVARAMADGVRRALAVEGRPADVGVATTGVAGPEPQGGRPVGTVFAGVAVGDRVVAVEGRFPGDRAAVRAAAVALALGALRDTLAE
ncbi:nicotinamide-nucleotide amidohydrolase family protein [Amnibacterium sp. CER49]|uniref:CinA family protein n=1 Tax=Amnibacterium sp. CER49 TaxID=3039161 RepID=UPI002447FD44|nr:nicotinamide-nucleotide amidohydrolase family protein [Amnibacterium sp. CER49]MDH2444997.1 nicotinamide-nucleotide amidohydrolase family protein [Amnibacterium sp. CER49]